MATSFEDWLTKKGIQKPSANVLDAITPKTYNYNMTYQSPEGKKFSEKKKSSDGASYEWQQTLLKDLPKSYGKNYEQKFDTLARQLGAKNNRDINEFKTWLDSKEYGAQTKMRDLTNLEQDMAQRKVDERNRQQAIRQQKEAEQKRLEQEQIAMQKENDEKHMGNHFLDYLNLMNPFNTDPEKEKKLEQTIIGVQEEAAANPIIDETDRFTTRLTNTALLGLPENLSPTAREFQSRDGVGMASDVLADILGYAAPGGLVASGLKGTKLGAKGVTEALKNPLNKQSIKTIAGQTAKEGAATGAIIGGGEIGVRELVNPEAYNWQDNLTKFGIDVAGGAILDPLITMGLGRGINKIASKGGSNPPNNPNTPIDDFSVVADNTEIPFDVTPNVQPINQIEPITPVSKNQRPDLETLMKAYNGQDVSNSTSTKAMKLTKQQDTNDTITKVPNKPIEELDEFAEDFTSTVANDFVPSPKGSLTVDIAPQQLKDIDGLTSATNDVYRIFDKVFGKNSKVTKRVLGEFDKSKEKYVDMQRKYVKELDEVIVKGLGIKKGSRLSGLVQDYGEGTIDLPTLQSTTKDWEKVIEADKWFRQKYDELIDQVNATRMQIYPNNPEKIVPKRKDYYRHFRELQGISGLRNIFDTPSQIDPHLAGLSDFSKPKSKFAGFMQRRGLGPYKSDAVGGFLDYVPSASYSTHIDPNINMFRQLRTELADKTEDTRNINRFIEYLNDFANDLSGKTNPFLDRFVQKYIPGNRKTMAVLNWVNSRVKANAILGNLGSVLAQVANIPNGVAFAKEHSVPGLMRTLASVMDKNQPIYNSPFMKERFIDSLYRKFDTNLIDQPQKAAGWLMESADRIGTSFVWNSTYEKALAQNIDNPIAYADKETRRLIAGRGVGEVPMAQKSKVTQMVIPFTLEVGNLWRVMKEFVTAKDFGGIAILFTANWLINRGMEEIRGSGVTFDPIDAIIDSFQEDTPWHEKGGRVAGEIFSNLPLGSQISSMYPEDGKLLGLQGPTRKEFFGDRDPQRFGTNLILTDAVTNPLFSAALPFGGNQLRKTLEGLETIRDEGSYKNGEGLLNSLPLMNDTNELKFPVENSNEDILKSLLFGPYATDNAREYFDKNRRPLSEKQTEEYHEAKEKGKGQQFYEDLMLKRLEDSTNRKIKEIEEDESLTKKERNAMIQRELDLLELKKVGGF